MKKSFRAIAKTSLFIAAWALLTASPLTTSAADLYHDEGDLPVIGPIEWGFGYPLDPRLDMAIGEYVSLSIKPSTFVDYDLDLMDSGNSMDSMGTITWHAGAHGFLSSPADASTTMEAEKLNHNYDISVYCEVEDAGDYYKDSEAAFTQTLTFHVKIPTSLPCQKDTQLYPPYPWTDVLFGLPPGLFTHHYTGTQFYSKPEPSNVNFGNVVFTEFGAAGRFDRWNDNVMMLFVADSYQNLDVDSSGTVFIKCNDLEPQDCLRAQGLPDSLTFSFDYRFTDSSTNLNIFIPVVLKKYTFIPFPLLPALYNAGFGCVTIYLTGGLDSDADGFWMGPWRALESPPII